MKDFAYDDTADTADDPPTTHISGTIQRRILAEFEGVEKYLRDISTFFPSREISLAITNLEQAKMWAFADARIKAGGSN